MTDSHETGGEPSVATSVDAAGNAGEAFVYLPPERSALRRTLYGLGALLAVFVVLAALGGWWGIRQINPPGAVGDPVALTIPTGTSTAQIGTLLQNQGVISSALVFQYYLKFKGVDRFKAGDYDGLFERDSMASVVARLKKGPLAPKTRELLIPEGFTLAEIKVKILETFPEMNAAELDTAFQTVRSKYEPTDSTNLEGLLFPATYEVLETNAVDEKGVVEQMVGKFEQVAAEIGLDDAQASVGLDPYQVVIGASLIEREAKVSGDRPKVARVIFNRLAAKQRLEIDASLEYALGVKGSGLTTSQLKTASPFNLRQVAGLPPTPISSPGKDALQAMLAPAPGDWLYYVLADKNGSHTFSSSYNDFLKAKKRAQQLGLLGG
ncbi:MAG: endolytic transglycosylase MltG [Actinomycetes bacterium]